MPRNGGGNTKRKQTHGTRGASWRAVTKARTMHVGDENSEAHTAGCGPRFWDGAKCQPWWPRHRAASRNLPTIPSVRSSAAPRAPDGRPHALRDQRGSRWRRLSGRLRASRCSENQALIVEILDRKKLEVRQVVHF